MFHNRWKKAQSIFFLSLLTLQPLVAWKASAQERGCYQTNYTTPSQQSTSWFVPQRTRGDSDFHGNGPAVTVRVRLRSNNNNVYLSQYMHAQETKSDWTTAYGSTEYSLVNSGQLARYYNARYVRILGILSDEFSEHTYTDSNHSYDYGYKSSGELVHTFKVFGDAEGREAGSRTGFSATLNPVVIRV